MNLTTKSILFAALSSIVFAACFEPENTQVACSDGVDNDGDGLVDCQDYTCAVFCEAPEDPEGPQDPGEPGESAANNCEDSITRPWTGYASCGDIGSEGRQIVNRLAQFWGTSPNTICAYLPGFGASGGCGTYSEGNATYCTVDNGIAWDASMLNRLHVSVGDYAAKVVVAHEWGHLNQAVTGLNNGFRTVLQNELHADCQAGVFVAIEELNGRSADSDAMEAFQSLCSFGDPVGFFDPNGHGDCTTRMNAFGHGYWSSHERFEGLCLSSAAAMEEMLNICAN